MQKLCSALATIVLMTSPAMAADQSDLFAPRETVSIKISTDGLDLNTAQGRSALRGRMERAINSVCNPQTLYSTYNPRDNQCYQEMALNAEKQLHAYAQNDLGGSTAKN